jgi:para-nitrobenzyl esterase
MSVVQAFRGIRYAKSERFGPSNLVDFDGPDARGKRGPVAPQNPSRLEIVNGPQAPLEQREDCQVLSVFTSSLTGRRPVMIWFHGGANLTGGGELPWYDGSSIVAEQDVVVVAVTARLGVLGYFHAEDIDGPTPAMTDQLNAISWVQHHIDQFGGDPDNVTLVGQSCGGSSIEIMLRWGVPDGVRGAIMQSGFFRTSTPYGRVEALERSQHFEEFIGCDPRALSVPQLLAKQREFLTVSPDMWMPIRPDTEQSISVPVVTGWTRHDAFPFLMLQEKCQQPPVHALTERAADIHRLNQELVIRETLSVASGIHKGGENVWLYEFAWDVPSSGWGASHCIDLPFLLGDFEAWAKAPLIHGVNRDVFEARGRQLRSYWGSFLRDHRPGDEWTPHDGQSDDVGYTFC